MSMEPLRIICELRTPIVNYDPVMLDGVLAAAVVREQTRGEMLPAQQEPYAINLPLHCLWRHPDNGLPLWAATCLRPAHPATDVVYMHKRAQTGEFTRGRLRKGDPHPRFTLDAQRGRWMERRVPVPVVATTHLEARAIGDAEEIKRLLARFVPHVGKRRGVGMGEVVRWIVEPVDVQTSTDSPTPLLITTAGALARPVPLAARAILDPYIPSEPSTAAVGWTPPYWLPATQAEGWRAEVLCR